MRAMCNGCGSCCATRRACRWWRLPGGLACRVRRCTSASTRPWAPARPNSIHLRNAIGSSYECADLGKQFRTQQTDIADHRLPFILVIHIFVSHHLTQQPVIVRNVGKLVKTAIQSLLEHLKHQHALQVHARMTGVFACFWSDYSNANTCRLNSWVTTDAADQATVPVCHLGTWD